MLLNCVHLFCVTTLHYVGLGNLEMKEGDLAVESEHAMVQAVVRALWAAAHHAGNHVV